MNKTKKDRLLAGSMSVMVAASSLMPYGLGISHGRQKTRRPDFARTVLFPSVRAFLFRFARISADLAYL